MPSATLIDIIQGNSLIKKKQAATILAPSGRPRFEIIINEKNKQVSTLIREMGKDGEKNMVKVVTLLIESVNSYYNVSRPITKDQATELAIEFVNENWWARIEDFVAFFESVKKQTYGKIYERLDPSIIWEHWAAYCHQREDHCVQAANAYKQIDFKERDTEADRVATKGNNMAGLIGDMKARFKK